MKRANGFGSVFPTGPDTFGIKWSEGKKRHSRAGFKSEAAAEAELARIRVNLYAGKPSFEQKKVVGNPALGELSKRFLIVREETRRAAVDDRSRWKKHLGPFFGKYEPGQVTPRLIHAYVEEKVKTLDPMTVRVQVALLSAFYRYLKDNEIYTGENPARGLPARTMELMENRHRPDDVPFIETVEDVARIFKALPEPMNVAYAIGAMAGLRTGEVFGLRWANVDLRGRKIHVRESWDGDPLKDKKARVAPILDSLLPILESWKKKSGGEGLVVTRVDPRKPNDKKTAGPILAEVLEKLGLVKPDLGFYEATRHTFASLWVIHGRPIEKLRDILGHYSVVVTERYAHLKPDHFNDADRAAFTVDVR